MNETTIDTEYQMRELKADFERRIEDLSNRQRRRSSAWWSPLGAIALLVSLIVAFQSRHNVREGAVTPTLEAGSFVLKDAEGVERAALGLGDGGGTSLTLSDAGGHERLRVSVLPDGSPGVTLLDQQGEARAILGLLADGTTTLVFADGGSVARGVFALTPDGASRVVFSDRDGITRTAVGVDGSGAPEINTIAVGSDRESGGDGEGG